MPQYKFESAAVQPFEKQRSGKHNKADKIFSVIRQRSSHYNFFFHIKAMPPNISMHTKPYAFHPAFFSFSNIS
jgi:hypothetical protein